MPSSTIRQDNCPSQTTEACARAPNDTGQLDRLERSLLDTVQQAKAIGITMSVCRLRIACLEREVARLRRRLRALRASQRTLRTTVATLSEAVSNLNGSGSPFSSLSEFNSMVWSTLGGLIEDITQIREHLGMRPFTSSRRQRSRPRR